MESNTRDYIALKAFDSSGGYLATYNMDDNATDRTLYFANGTTHVAWNHDGGSEVTYVKLTDLTDNRVVFYYKK
jgi:hypothetical protein